MILYDSVLTFADYTGFLADGLDGLHHFGIFSFTDLDRSFSSFECRVLKGGPEL